MKVSVLPLLKLCGTLVRVPVLWFRANRGTGSYKGAGPRQLKADLPSIVTVLREMALDPTSHEWGGRGAEKAAWLSFRELVLPLLLFVWQAGHHWAIAELSDLLPTNIHTITLIPLHRVRLRDMYRLAMPNHSEQQELCLPRRQRLMWSLLWPAETGCLLC